MKTLTKLFFFFSATTTFAQQYTAPTVEWQQVYGGMEMDEARSIQQTKDGGYIVAGNTNSLDGNLTGITDSVDRYSWILKLDNEGKIEWQKTLKKSNTYSITEISNGYLFLGTLPVEDSISSKSWKDSVWVIKCHPITWEKFGVVEFNSNGNIASKHIFDDLYYGNVCDKQTTDKGFILGVNVRNWNKVDSLGNRLSKNYRAVVRLDDMGNEEWRKEIVDTNRSELRAIVETKDRGYILVEELHKSVRLSKSSGYSTFSTLILKVNGDGKVEWQKKFEVGGDYHASDVISTVDGYIVVGQFHPETEWVKWKKGKNVMYKPKTMTNTNIWAIKLNFEGEVVWQKQYGGEHTEVTCCSIRTNDGNFVIAGATYSYRTEENVKDELHKRGNEKYYNSNAYIIKINEYGDLLWQKTIGGEDYEFPAIIQQTKDGAYILGGITSSFDAERMNYHFNDNGNQDLWIVKLSPDVIK